MDDATIGAWRDAVVRSFAERGAEAAALLPNLVGAVVILLVGWGAASLLAFVSRRALRGVGLDRLGARHRVAERAGLGLALSEAVGRLVFWVVLGIFALASVHTLGSRAVIATIDRLVAYLPNLVGAALTAILGVLLARFVGSVTSSAAMAAGVESAARLGLLVQGLALALVAAITVEQLGLETDVLVLPLTALLGAGGFAAGLAFALGARPVITHILAGHFLKRSLPRDTVVEVAGERGVVERVGATATVFRDGDRRWSVPNAQLLEQVVVR